MKRSYSSLAGLALLAMASVPTSALAAQETEPVRLAALAHDDLGLYLDADEMVETASRYPKPMGQVAENVTVITAQEIELLHAHTLNEVLRQLPGLFMLSYGQDFGSPESIRTQGSEDRHTLVLIDGVRLNNSSGGDALTNGLPLGIIKRIEVIKGPASSSWGSSLGGVVNIITKETGKGPRPSGQMTASVGEKGTSETSAQAGGLLGPVGYYLYGGNLETDGHWRDNWFDNEPLYAKLSLPLPRLTLGATIGHSAPRYKSFEAASLDRADIQLNRSTFSTAYLDAPLGREFNFHLAASRFEQAFDWQTQALGLGGYVHVNGAPWAAGELVAEDLWQEKTDNLSGRLSWSGQRHSAVVGFESGRSELDYSGDWAYWSELWAYLALPYDAAEERRAAFANAALTWGRLTLSPGLRYDISSVSENAVSPSLGATYRLGVDTILRGTVARGFNTPNLANLFDRRFGNPDLAPERVTSVQAGLETVAVAPLYLAATLFHHRVTEVRGQDAVSMWENQGVVRRHGLELQADTTPWRHLSFGVKASLVSEDAVGRENDTMYAANLTALYDNPALLTARLGGRYIWWYEANRGELPKHDDFIWDLTLSREFYSRGALRAEAFVVGRNLFNGSQYWDIDYQNPGRWLEGGVTVKF